MPATFEQLEAKGFKFVTVSELLNARLATEADADAEAVSVRRQRRSPPSPIPPQQLNIAA